MKHAREDYQHIQDPHNKIPEGEPVFLIRGQDKAGPMAVQVWATLAEAFGADKNIVSRARRQAKQMQRWQLDKGSKVPDLPGVPKTDDDFVALAIGNAGQVHARVGQELLLDGKPLSEVVAGLKRSGV